MTWHIGDVELGDHADGTLDAARSGEITAHLDRCATCAARAAKLASLTQRLRALSLEASPERDLLAGIRARVATADDAARPRLQALAPSRRPAFASRVLRAAAALLLFAGGVGAGRVWFGAPEPVGARAESDPLRVAADVQRAGTAYVSALARLGSSAPDSAIMAQGRQAALATLYGAALQIAALSDHSGPTESIVQSVFAVHRADLNPAAVGRRVVPF